MGMSKSDKNHLVPLMDKFLTRDKLIWIKLNDFERQQTVLYLAMKFCKRAICEAHGKQLSGHDAVNKTYIRISDSYFLPGMKADIKMHIDSCVQCQV